MKFFGRVHIEKYSTIVTWATVGFNDVLLTEILNIIEVIEENSYSEVVVRNDSISLYRMMAAEDSKDSVKPGEWVGWDFDGKMDDGELAPVEMIHMHVDRRGAWWTGYVKDTHVPFRTGLIQKKSIARMLGICNETHD